MKGCDSRVVKDTNCTLNKNNDSVASVSVSFSGFYLYLFIALTPHSLLEPLTPVRRPRRNGNYYSRPRLGKCGTSGASWCASGESAFDNRDHLRKTLVLGEEVAL